MIKKENIGECYILNYRYIVDNKDWKLVHGYITFPGRTHPVIPHAWCLRDDIVYDAVLGREMKWEHYKALYRAEVDRQYTFKETLDMAVKYKTYGPWHNGKELDLSCYDDSGKLIKNKLRHK